MSIREPYPPPRPPPQPRPPPPPPLPPGDCNWNGGAFEKDCNESPSLPPSPPLAPPEAYPLINIVFFAAGGALVCCILLGCSYCLFRKEKRRRATLMGKAAPLVKGLDKMLEVDEDEKWRPTAPEEGSAVRRATVEGKHPEPDDFDEEAPLDLEELPPDLPRRTAGAKGRRKPSRSSSAPGPSSVEFGSALRRQSTMPVAPAESYPGGRRKSSVEEEARIDEAWAAFGGDGDGVDHLLDDVVVPPPGQSIAEQVRASAEKVAAARNEAAEKAAGAAERESAAKAAAAAKVALAAERVAAAEEKVAMAKVAAYERAASAQIAAAEKAPAPASAALDDVDVRMAAVGMALERHDSKHHHSSHRRGSHSSHHHHGERRGSRDSSSGHHHHHHGSSHGSDHHSHHGHGHERKGRHSHGHHQNGDADDLTVAPAPAGAKLKQKKKKGRKSGPTDAELEA